MNAFRKKLLLFIFMDGVAEEDIQHLRRGLIEYVEISRNWDGSLASAYPLIVAFSKDATNARSVADYHAFGWTILQKLHEVDPAPWPANVGADPNSPSWSMCFNGMPIFCNMSSPAHRVRRSRNLGEHFLLVINPRERFDVIAGDFPAGRKVRSNIRGRIARYDATPNCPQLASYEAGGIEWWQYGIIEENVERSDKCPFVT
jgi:N-omega-hydroxy-L-arginine synthase